MKILYEEKVDEILSECLFVSLPTGEKPVQQDLWWVLDAPGPGAGLCQFSPPLVSASNINPLFAT